jgi:hypothetical protein
LVGLAWTMACAALLGFRLHSADGHVLFRVRNAIDVHGREHRLGEGDGVKGVALVFLGPECPISQRYVPELNRIAARSDSNAIPLYGVISSPTMTRTQALEFVQEYAVTFPVLFDESGRFARWLRPTHVPEAFVLKADGDIAYRGRIDDGYAAPGKPRTVIQHREMRDALAAVQSGKAPPRSFARPVGCYFEEWR